MIRPYRTSIFFIFILSFSISCIHKPLFTLENQSDYPFIAGFPHNSLVGKTNIEQIERGPKAFLEHNPDWDHFKSLMAPGDEVWECSTDHLPETKNSSENKNSARFGVCLIRKGKIIAIYDYLLMEII